MPFLRIKYTHAISIFFFVDVKRRSLSIVDKLYYLTNESNVINESSSNASRYILHSIDDAKQQTLRAENLTKKVKMISNMTANFGMLLMNQTKVIKGTFELFAQLYDELNRTHEELKKNQEQLERTNNDLKSLEVMKYQRMHSHMYSCFSLLNPLLNHKGEYIKTI